jgi:hypothetical protein
MLVAIGLFCNVLESALQRKEVFLLRLKCIPPGLEPLPPVALKLFKSISLQRRTLVHGPRGKFALSNQVHFEINI